MTEVLEKNTTATIIIPSYNSIHTISHTIEGIKKQTCINAIKEIIIVDSSDDENTHNWLKSQEDDFVIVTRSGYKVMPAIQRNIGAKMATGDLLCFIDSDAFPSESWLETILEYYQKGYRIGGGGYEVPYFQKKSKIAYAQYFMEFSAFMGFGKVERKMIVASCNLFCDRLFFLEYGGFPEIRASEDSLFCLKMGKVEKPLYIPHSVVFHIFRVNRQHYLSNQRMLGKYIYIFRKQSFNQFYYKGFMPYLLFPAFMVFKFLRIFARALRTGKLYKIRYFFLSIPLMVSGLSEWGKGFVEGINDKTKW